MGDEYAVLVFWHKNGLGGGKPGKQAWLVSRSSLRHIRRLLKARGAIGVVVEQPMQFRKCNKSPKAQA